MKRNLIKGRLPLATVRRQAKAGALPSNNYQSCSQASSIIVFPEAKRKTRIKDEGKRDNSKDRSEEGFWWPHSTRNHNVDDDRKILINIFGPS
ncbi:hypothetical protein V6N12_072475 [Hibiscus sabdariffa]|uniref:Uncharacterized protein n=1 Tax=Hibiscus sabdariffa TaxID=183260 RepID=A0ABR2FN64_9ROSI